MSKRPKPPKASLGSVSTALERLRQIMSKTAAELKPVSEHKAVSSQPIDEDPIAKALMEKAKASSAAQEHWPAVPQVKVEKDCPSTQPPMVPVRISTRYNANNPLSAKSTPAPSHKPSKHSPPAPSPKIPDLAVRQEDLSQQPTHSQLNRPKNTPAKSVKSKPQMDYYEGRKHALNQIREIVKNASPTIESRPASVLKRTATAILSAIEVGAHQFANCNGPDLDNGFIVGFDFGTSSLKLAVRQPYQADDRVVAMPAPPELRSNDHPYLWQTALWFHPTTGRFSLVPEDGAVVLEGFKTGLLSGFGGERISANAPISRIEAAIAYLTLHFAHMLGWYLQTRPLAPGGGDHFLGINIGIPVDTRDNHALNDVFKRIVESANALAPNAASLSLDMVRARYAQSRPELPLGFELVPELTAAVAGYAAAPTAQTGAHMLVDVGASTLDIVAFHLVRVDMQHPQISVFAAGVELLGAAALETARAAGIKEAVFKDACDHQFEVVYGKARSSQRARKTFHPGYRSRPIQLLTTGGGCKTRLHALFISEMTKEKVLGAAKKFEPSPPTSISKEDCDRARLLIAYGLTRDINELHELRLPSEIEDLSDGRAEVCAPISKDQV